MLRSATRVFAVPIVLAVFWAACGSGTDPTTTTDDTGATNTPTTTATTAPASTTTTAPSGTTSTTTSDTASVTVFFATGDGSDCTQVEGFERSVAAIEDPVVAAFGALLSGPTAEETSAGAGSFFSADTAHAVRSLSLDDGLLSIDFTQSITGLNNASTSCGSASLLASLNATAFQFDGVERVRYSVFGSCNSFYGLLQGECQDQTRTGSLAADLDTNEEASGSGCTPGAGPLPDGDWFGYVDTAGTDSFEFDLACWFTGIAAADAATEDGSESPPPNDYYVRNASTDLRAVSVGGTTEVAQLSSTGGPDTTTVGFDEWSAAWASREFQPGVWITVENGEVVHIVEQYVP